MTGKRIFTRMTSHFDDPDQIKVKMDDFYVTILHHFNKTLKERWERKKDKLIRHTIKLIIG